MRCSAPGDGHAGAQAASWPRAGSGAGRRPPRTRILLRSFLDQDEMDGFSEDPSAGREPAPGSRGRRTIVHEWHIHRVQFVECTEHFVHDYARSLRRRRVYRTRISQFHQWRLLMARAFQAYRDSLEGPQLVELACLMIDHRQAIESAAGMRFPAKGG
jgi:hypothetical protein